MSRLGSSRRRPSASRLDLIPKKPARKEPALGEKVAKKLACEKSIKNSATKKSVPQTPCQRELTTKRRGELAELAFVLKAAGLGFGVSRPFGDSERYDVILDARDLNDVGRTLLSAAFDLPVAQSDAHVGTVAPGCPAPRKYRAAAAPARTHESAVEPSRSLGGTAAIPPDPSPPLWRVQIKCSTQLAEGLYRVNAHRRANGRAVPYLPGEIHFFAAYIIPEDTWYILPLAALRGRTSLLFRRRRDPKPGLYDPYREAWHLLRPKD